MSNTLVKNINARRSRARGFVLQSLYQWSLTGLPVADILAQVETKFDMRRADTEYYRLLLKEVIAKVSDWDAAFLPFLDRDLGALDPISVNVLRIAACELQQHWEVPYKVVIDEAVKLAKKYGPEHSFSYINGVLDKTAESLRAAEYAAAHATA